MFNRRWETALTILATATIATMVTTLAVRGYSLDKFGRVVAPWGELAFLGVIGLFGLYRSSILIYTSLESRRSADAASPQEIEAAVESKLGAWDGWEPLGMGIVCVGLFSGALSLPVRGQPVERPEMWLRYFFAIGMAGSGLYILWRLIVMLYENLRDRGIIQVVTVTTCGQCGRHLEQCRCKRQ